MFENVGDGAEVVTENIQKCCCCLIKTVATVGEAVYDKVNDFLWFE